MLENGISQIVEEQELFQQYQIFDPKEVEIQKERLKQLRTQRNSVDQRDYEFAHSTLMGYVLYHASYQLVSASTPLQNAYDINAAYHLNNYYLNKRSVNVK